MTVATATQATDHTRRARRTAALGYPEDLSDLDIDREQQGDDAYARAAGRPRLCPCPEPVIDAGQDEPACFKCGRPVRVAEGRSALVVASGPAETVPQDSGEPSHNKVPGVAESKPAGVVPWSAEQERRLRELASRHGTAQWTLADAALQAVPVGRTRKPSGALALVRELAARVGMEPGNLVKLRSTAHAWPPAHRVEGVSYSVHSDFGLGGPAKAAERAALLRRLAESGPVTTERVRRERGNKSRPNVDPLRGLLNRVVRLSGAFVRDLPAAKSRPVSPVVCARRAEQLRSMADLLDGLAVSGAVPHVDELRERLSA